MFYGDLEIAGHARRQPQRLRVGALHPLPLGLKTGERLGGIPIQRRDAHQSDELQALGGLSAGTDLVNEVRAADIHPAALDIPADSSRRCW